MKIIIGEQLAQIAGGLVQISDVGDKYQVTLLHSNDTFEYATTSTNYFFLHSGKINTYDPLTGSTSRLDSALYTSYLKNGAMVFVVQKDALV